LIRIFEIVLLVAGRAFKPRRPEIVTDGSVKRETRFQAEV
jgi:hypothetical protein